ncbi:pentapeptide repeat-containing protein [Cellulomonas sp. JH27-2]|nr:pentapeptide repeat-containing protein [Cellulomonas sp. JH27-2]
MTSAYNGATLRRVDFSRAALASVAGPRLLRLDRCTFAGADLRHATLDGWRFKLCDLTGANLRGASLRGASFAGCDLTGADLRDTDLTDVWFGSVGVRRGATATRLDGVLCDAGVSLELS